MFNVSPFLSEWLRASGMTGTGILMLWLGLRMSKCSDRVYYLISITAGFVAVAAAVTHFQPVRAYLGYTFDLMGGEGAVAGYALLLLLGAARARTRRSLFVIAACLAFLVIVPFALSPLYWHYFGAELYTNYPDKDGCVQQTTGVTCAPASASMLLNQYGIRVSEGVMAERAGTNLIGGTNEYSLARALQKIVGSDKYTARAGHMSYQQVCDLGCPFVAFVKLPNIGGHAIMVASLQSDTATVIDPLYGSSERVPISEFMHEWTGTVIWITVNASPLIK